MLKHLRKKGVSKKVLWVVAIIIILSFGVFGSATILDRTGVPTDAGKIFGKSISLQNFEKSYRHTQIQSILRYGDSYEKIRQYLDLDSQTWDRIILLTEAQKRKIKISDQQVVDTIESYQFFHRNGKFDSQLYDRAIRYAFRCEPRDFEEGVRESLMFEKLFNEETASVNISDKDIEEAYAKKNEKIQVSYVFIAAQDYVKDLTADPVEIQRYFDDHKESFRQPMAINVQFLQMDFPKDASKEAKTAVANEAETLFKELEADPDLAKAAQKHNLTVNETGFFSMESVTPKTGLPLEVMQKAFDLKKDSVSYPIESANGYYLLKLKEKKDSYIPEFTQIEDKVKSEVLLDKAQGITKERSAEILKQIKDELTANPGMAFKDIAATLGLTMSQTAPFARGEYLPTIGLSKEFQDAAFALNETNKISEAIEIAKGYAILYLDQPPQIDKEKFAKEKDEFAKQLLAAKRGEAFSSFISRLRTKANLQDNISKLKKAAQETRDQP